MYRFDRDLHSFEVEHLTRRPANQICLRLLSVAHNAVLVRGNFGSRGGCADGRLEEQQGSFMQFLVGCDDLNGAGGIEGGKLLTPKT